MAPLVASGFECKTLSPHLICSFGALFAQVLSPLTIKDRSLLSLFSMKLPYRCSRAHRNTDFTVDSKGITAVVSPPQSQSHEAKGKEDTGILPKEPQQTIFESSPEGSSKHGLYCPQ